MEPHRADSFGILQRGSLRPPRQSCALSGLPFPSSALQQAAPRFYLAQLYVLHAEQHEEHGHTVDTKQARQMIAYLDDIITLMQIQIRARQDGGYLPFADTVLPETSHKEKEDERENEPF